MQVIEIVAVIANFGFLNRWTDTMGTELERPHLAWSDQHLSDHGWDPGKHAAGDGTDPAPHALLDGPANRAGTA